MQLSNKQKYNIKNGRYKHKSNNCDGFMIQVEKKGCRKNVGSIKFYKSIAKQ